MEQKIAYFLVITMLLVIGILDTSDGSGCSRKEKAIVLMDVAKDYISRAKDLHPMCIEDDMDANCERNGKSWSFLEMATNLISDAKRAYPNDEPNEMMTSGTEVSLAARNRSDDFVETMTFGTGISSIARSRRSGGDCDCPKHLENPADCSEILLSGKNKSGVYTIWPRSRIMWNNSLTVYCDMDTDGGGWTVIQRRGNFSTPKDYFYKGWSQYKDGFGNVEEEFWIGNDNLHAITNQAHYAVRFDLKAADGDTGYAQYHTFYVEEESYNYKLHITGYFGNVGDATDYHNNNTFSTYDRDNDQYSSSCASDNKGAWWYNICQYSNLNGLYQPGEDSVKGLSWFQWKKRISLAGVEMKLRAWKIPKY